MRALSSLLPLLPALPLAGALALGAGGPRLGRRVTALVGVGSVALAAALALALAVAFLVAPPADGAHRQELWRWLSVGGLQLRFALLLDPLSLVMVLVVSVVGALIHLYSVEHMAADVGFTRFFASMNLFVASMLVLVLADDLALLFFGWEGVGLCSFLLIGFWYEDPANARAARKAFVVTRVGDAAMLVGIILLAVQLGTLQLASLTLRAVASWPMGTAAPTLVAALLLLGAVGKSAQLPLQTWLPDAMAGPTPVSALIHAATMVTAGVYLIARLHGLFELAPAVLVAVAVIGAATLLLAGAAALAQRDLKRALAYSTISQLGYMFVALGVSAWSAAIFHLTTHACFKALLFLAAGVVLQATHEHDLDRMGGLRRRLPLTFWTFLIGAASLAGLPLVTAGFYSKDLILWSEWTARSGGAVLWGTGLVGTLLTGLYAFRLVFLVFLGEPRADRPVTYRPTWRVSVPLVTLAALSILAGLLDLPTALVARPLLARFLQPVLPAAASEVHGAATEVVFLAIGGLTALLAVALAARWFLGRTITVDEQSPSGLPGVPAALQRLWGEGWGFDRLYDTLLVRPLAALTRALSGDPLDGFFRGLASGARLLHLALRQTQRGRLRWAVAALAAGAVLLVALAVLR